MNVKLLSSYTVRVLAILVLVLMIFSSFNYPLSSVTNSKVAIPNSLYKIPVSNDINFSIGVTYGDKRVKEVKNPVSSSTNVSIGATNGGKGVKEVKIPVSNSTNVSIVATNGDKGVKEVKIPVSNSTNVSIVATNGDKGVKEVKIPVSNSTNVNIVATNGDKGVKEVKIPVSNNTNVSIGATNGDKGVKEVKIPVSNGTNVSIGATNGDKGVKEVKIPVSNSTNVSIGATNGDKGVKEVKIPVSNGTNVSIGATNGDKGVKEVKIPVSNSTNVSIGATNGDKGVKEVVALSSYYDGRHQYSYTNSTVILASVLNKMIELNSILGCEVDGVTQLEPMVIIKPIVLDGYIKETRPHLTHTDIIVNCFNMYINKNSTVRLIYQVEGVQHRVAVVNDVVMPVQTDEDNSVMVCSTGYGSPPYLDHWLLYQRTINVKFIHLNVHNSFLKNINESNVLQKFINSGYVKMIVWEEYLNKSQVFLYSQSLKYQDCMLRYQHAYKYIIIYDFDEFFIPLNMNKSIISYVDHYFRNSSIGTVFMPSVIYYCPLKEFYTTNATGDGNVTKLYDTTKSIIRTPPSVKSLHLLRAIKEASVHSCILFPPYKLLHLPNWEFYIAHLKLYSSTNKCV